MCIKTETIRFKTKYHIYDSLFETLCYNNYIILHKLKNEKKYMMQLAKVIALLAVSPALSALIGLWNLLVAMIVLIIATIFFIWIGIKIMKNVE